jgi:hypothetical protein
MTEFFIKSFLVIAIASAVLCIILAVIEGIRVFLGKDNEEEDDYR